MSNHNFLFIPEEPEGLGADKAPTLIRIPTNHTARYPIWREAKRKHGKGKLYLDVTPEEE